MKTQITIEGVVEVPEGVSVDQFTDRFLQWLESQGMTFGGGMGPYVEEEE